jgi:hypothetical protein
MIESSPSKTKKANVPFKERVPTVLKIIEEAEEPIQYKELLEKLRDKTGVKISEHTLIKCLDQLLVMQNIAKIKEKGRGNPVKYYMKKTKFTQQPLARLKVNSLLLKQFADDDSPFGTEANLWSVITFELSQVVAFLIDALYAYSKLSNSGNKDARQNAYLQYKGRIETVLVPFMEAMHELVKRPVEMSIATELILFNLFIKPFNIIPCKPLHPFQHMSKNESDEMIKLVSKDGGNTDFVFIKEISEKIDLEHIEDFEPLKTRINSMKMLSKAYTAMFGNGDRENNEYTKNFIKRLREFEEDLIAFEKKENEKLN